MYNLLSGMGRNTFAIVLTVYPLTKFIGTGGRVGAVNSERVSPSSPGII